MKHQTLGVAAALMLALGAGYWAGAGRVGTGDTATATATTAVPAAPARKLLYYRNPMGRGRHLAGAEEGFHGHGLHRRL